MEELVGETIREKLSSIATRLRSARREALADAAVPVDERTWTYAGRTWSWPTGESLRYFRDLAPGERAVLDRACDEHGVEVVGVGTGRVAVAFPEAVGDEPLVAKLARYGPSAEMGAGRPQNRREQRVWEAVGGHPFLPVRAADEAGDWVVMPEASMIGAVEREATGDDGAGAGDDDDTRASGVETVLDRLGDALAPHRERFHFDELKPENVGAYDGRYWVVDYGRPAGEALFVEPPGDQEAELPGDQGSESPGGHESESP